MEYLYNCRRRNLPEKIIFRFRFLLFERYSMKYGFEVPINVFGPGLSIAHKGTIVVNPYSKVGSNCRIHVGVNIGNYAPLDENWVPDNVPVLGNNVYIGPGAKLYGKITIGDNASIGANAVVNKDVPAGVTVAGVPAKIISSKSSNVVHGDENY